MFSDFVMISKKSKALKPKKTKTTKSKKTKITKSKKTTKKSLDPAR